MTGVQTCALPICGFLFKKCAFWKDFRRRAVVPNMGAGICRIDALGMDTWAIGFREPANEWRSSILAPKGQELPV